MKKLIALFIGILLVMAAGCIGGKTTTSTSTSTTTSSPASEASTSPTVTTASTTSATTATTTSSPPPKKYTLEELIKNIKSIEYFTFTDNTTMAVQLVMEVNGTVMQRQNMTFEFKRRAYVDLKNRIAETNTTTLVSPGGGEASSRQVVIGDTIYIEANGMTHEIENGTLANLTWNYNPVSFALLYLQKKPEKTGFVNGTQLLYYRITSTDLLKLMGSIAPTGKANVSVWNGILELGFRDGELVSERTMYEFRLIMDINGNRVTETGKVYDEIHIFDINVKKNVKVPKKSVKV